MEIASSSSSSGVWRAERLCRDTDLGDRAAVGSRTIVDSCKPELAKLVKCGWRYERSSRIIAVFSCGVVLVIYIWISCFLSQRTS